MKVSERLVMFLAVLEAPPLPEGPEAGTRTISWSEVSTALTCMAQHAFRYTGRLTDGHTLKPKALAPTLSRGLAWGAGVAAWHQTADPNVAFEAVDESLSEDADRLRKHGLYLPDEHERMRGELVALLDHYAETTDRLPGLTRLEEKLLTPIPSRGSARPSSRYRFEAHIDGWVEDPQGRPWLVEFKLRGRLWSVELIQRVRQIRWYAWALREAKGVNPVGVLVDERLAVAPVPPKLLKAGGPSHAKDQYTTPDLYRRACELADEEPRLDALAAFGSRVWHQRVPVMFRRDELDEAGRELVTAAQLIQQLDSGRLEPLRNAKTTTCRYCDFEEVCDDPSSRAVDTYYERTVPKRLRIPNRSEG